MGHLVVSRAEVPAGQQFTGSEFRVQSPSGKALRLIELDLFMGVELKTFRVEKRDVDGSTIALLQQSTDSIGTPAAVDSESLILTGSEFATHLSRGQQIQITTSGATSAMRAVLYLEEVEHLRVE